jgi:glycine cleavage system transcriptional repressor
MPRNFVLTLTGPDKIGFVNEVTRLLLDRGGNVETSRMTRLGGEFAILMLVSMPDDQFAGMEADLEGLTARGYKVTTTRVEPTHAEAHRGWLPYRIEVRGSDHEGIIHEVAHYLSQHNINIESVDSETTPAPMSGLPLFTMTAHVVVPPDLPEADWEDGLTDIGGHMNLDIQVTALHELA